MKPIALKTKKVSAENSTAACHRDGEFVDLEALNSESLAENDSDLIDTGELLASLSEPDPSELTEPRPAPPNLNCLACGEPLEFEPLGAGWFSACIGCGRVWFWRDGKLSPEPTKAPSEGASLNAASLATNSDTKTLIEPSSDSSRTQRSTVLKELRKAVEKLAATLQDLECLGVGTRKKTKQPKAQKEVEPPAPSLWVSLEKQETERSPIRLWFKP